MLRRTWTLLVVAALTFSVSATAASAASPTPAPASAVPAVSATPPAQKGDSKPPVSTTPPVPGKFAIAAGTTIPSGGELSTTNYSHLFRMEKGGNAVIFAPGGLITWTTGTSIPGSRMVFQADGNLVMYTPWNTPVWSSRSAGPNSVNGRLDMQTDGNMVLYGPGYYGPNAAWSSWYDTGSDFYVMNFARNAMAAGRADAYARSVIERRWELSRGLALEEDSYIEGSQVRPAVRTSAAEARQHAIANGVDPAKVDAGSFWCAWRDGTKTYRNLTRIIVLYKWNQHLKWCYELGVKVHEIAERDAWISNVDSWSVKWDGGHEGDLRAIQGMNTHQVKSMAQTHVEHCILKWGCMGNTYPIVTIYGTDQGKSTVTGSV